MSFSSQIKEKLCKSEYGCMNCAAYELSGALMFGGNIGSDSIKFATENENIAKRITADNSFRYKVFRRNKFNFIVLTICFILNCRINFRIKRFHLFVFFHFPISFLIKSVELKTTLCNIIYVI